MTEDDPATDTFNIHHGREDQPVMVSILVRRHPHIWAVETMDGKIRETGDWTAINRIYAKVLGGAVTQASIRYPERKP